MRLASTTLVMLAALCWGLSGGIGGILMDDGWDPFVVSFYRGAIGLLCVLLWLALRPRGSGLGNPRLWGWSALAGLGVAGNFAFYFLSIAEGSVAVAATLMYCAPVFVYLTSFVLRLERPSPLKWAAIALVLLGAVVGGIWFVTSQASDEPEPDGSLIAAPEGPYKTKPENPGGKTFVGTGDTSFAVGEGQTREGKLAETTTKPPVDAGTSSGPTIASTVNEGTRATPVAGTSVQVGAYPRRADAEAAWSNLMRQTEALNGVSHRVVEAQVDIGTVYRLQAITGDRASASRLCAALKADGLACFVK